MQTLREWLEACGCYDVEEVVFAVRGVHYQGCRYKQDRPTPRGSRARSEGRETYTQEAVYVLGDTPACFQRTSRTAFVIEGEPFEWYVMSWVAESTASHPKFAKFHFERKPAFQIGPWTFEGEKIDEFERTPYQRVPARLEVVGAVV
jgi:hypothetical protein